MMGLTKRQRECLDFIRSEVKEKGIAPAINEIASALNLRSNHSALELVRMLIARDHIIQTVYRDGRSKPRGLKLVEPEHNGSPDCPCARCPARKAAYHQFIQALQVAPKLPNDVTLIGIKVLPDSTRLYWLRGFPQKPCSQNRPKQVAG